MKLYGVCRLENKCVCGLCAKIKIEVEAPRIRRAVRLKPEPKARPVNEECGCGLRKTVERVPTVVPTFVVVEKFKRVSCGCLWVNNERLKWCYVWHDPNSDPNTLNLAN